MDHSSSENPCEHQSNCISILPEEDYNLNFCNYNSQFSQSVVSDSLRPHELQHSQLHNFCLMQHMACFFQFLWHVLCYFILYSCIMVFHSIFLGHVLWYFILYNFSDLLLLLISLASLQLLMNTRKDQCFRATISFWKKPLKYSTNCLICAFELRIMVCSG